MRVVIVAAAIAACAAAPIAIVGCGASPPPARPPLASDGGVDGGNVGALSGDELPSLEALAARGATAAPLMRELLRVERAAPRSPLLRADRDLCLRAVFAASRPVRAWFADEAGVARGEITTGASGAIPPRGPACAKKGESLQLVVEGESAGDVAARAVLFAAP